MSTQIGIAFPTEADALYSLVQSGSHFTADERFQAILDLLGVAESLSRAGCVHAEQLEYHKRLEEEWQDRVKEFIRKHVAH